MLDEKHKHSIEGLDPTFIVQSIYYQFKNIAQVTEIVNTYQTSLPQIYFCIYKQCALSIICQHLHSHIVVEMSPPPIPPSLLGKDSRHFNEFYLAKHTNNFPPSPHIPKFHTCPPHTFPTTMTPRCTPSSPIPSS